MSSPLAFSSLHISRDIVPTTPYVSRLIYDPSNTLIHTFQSQQGPCQEVAWGDVTGCTRSLLVAGLLASSIADNYDETMRIGSNMAKGCR